MRRLSHELLTETLGLDRDLVREAATTSARPWRVLPEFATHPPCERLWGMFSGLYLEREHRRSYPRGATSPAELLGVVRDGEAHGGVEQAFDKWLQGQSKAVAVSWLAIALGRPIPGESVLVEGCLRRAPKSCLRSTRTFRRSGVRRYWTPSSRRRREAATL